MSLRSTRRARCVPWAQSWQGSCVQSLPTAITGDELHATRRRLAATPISTLGISTDLSLTEMAMPIKPETMPRGTHTRPTCG
jgi:hypothetical protein